MTEPDNPALEFWDVIGERVPMSELKVGEVFIVERAGGKIRECARVARIDGDSFVCVRADFSELGENYKVLMMEK